VDIKKIWLVRIGQQAQCRAENLAGFTYQGGTGLGLHIVYSIVTNRLGGRLDLDSAPGSGTRIQIILPRVAPLEQAAE